jgi:hypothetical protein
VHRAMRAFLRLKSLPVAKRLLYYVGVPSFIKGIMATGIAMYKDWSNNSEAWSFDKTWKTLFISIGFSGIFESISYNVNSALEASPAKIKSLERSWNRMFRIWKGGRDRKAFCDRMRKLAQELNLNRHVERTLDYLSGPEGAVIFNLAESFSTSMANKKVSED